MDSGFQLLQALLVLLGVILRYWLQMCAETEMLHDATQPGRILLMSVEGL
jgi:hypothetical protein